MKVLVFCCKGFEMMEFAPFYDVVGWAKSEYGYDISLDTCGFIPCIPSAFWNTEIKADRLIQDIIFVLKNTMRWLFPAAIIFTVFLRKPMMSVF